MANGADVNAGALDGATPLHDAVELGLENYVVFLLKNGANPHQKNEVGKSPLDIASTPMKKTIQKFQDGKLDSNEKSDDATKAPEVEDEEMANDELNDSSNSVLATPLENDEVISIPSSIDESQKSDTVSDKHSTIDVVTPSQNIEEVPSGQALETPAETTSSSVSLITMISKCVSVSKFYFVTFAGK